MAEHAVKVAARFDRNIALNAYAGLIDELLHGPDGTPGLNPDVAEQR